MKYFVKINVRSIKKNPNAGSTRSAISSGKSITVIASGGKKIPSQKEIEKCLANIGLVLRHITLENHMEHYEHQPEPKYFYEYEKKQIQCEFCATKFSVNKLQSDSVGDIYSDAICPSCGEWHCCEVEYQTIGNLIKEKPKIFRELRNKK